MAKQALIMTNDHTLVDWSEDHDYSQDPPSIYRPADHTIITTAFTSLPGNWKDYSWIWNDDIEEFVKSKEVKDPCKNQCCNGDIDLETVDDSSTVFGDAMHLDTDGNWIRAKGDATATMLCGAIALESGTGQKKLLKRGFVRNDSWNFTIGAWIYVSYSTAGGLTQDLADTAGQIQQKVGYAYRSNVMWFDPSKTALKRK